MRNKGVIIVAGGSGTRMGNSVPKQFLPLGKEGKPVLVHTLDKFREAVPEAKMTVVLPPSEIQRWEDIATRYGIGGTHTVCGGGQTRFQSVRNALDVLAECDIIAVHDGVRPMVTVELIRSTFREAEQYGSAVPVIEPADSLRILDEETPERSMPLDRGRVRIVQTPQVFRSELLFKAYQSAYDPRYTDDATVVQRLGIEPHLCMGETSNIKITTPADLAVAEALMAAPGVGGSK